MSVQHLATLQANQRQQVLDLIQRSAIFDNSPPIAEHILLHLRHGGDKSDSHLVVEETSKVIGYAHLDQTDLVAGPSVELVVDPDHRSFGIGKQLLSKAVEICGQNLRLWVHGENEAAAAIAYSFNFEKIRTVLQMQKQLTEIEKLPDIDPKIIIRSFLPGLDSNDWLSLNNKVFKDHPEQSDWQSSDLNHRLGEEWFDEKGFFIASLNNQMIGSTWTKIHGALTHDHCGFHDHPAIGEIYITAVDPAYSGSGLGRALTITALNHLKYQGLHDAMLYVDFDNARALKLY
ncbi:MAG: mycothiol synthase, partial [Actinobacteria bacterium]|nr:mycothiol synthase [Actinomycetota bacterium]